MFPVRYHSHVQARIEANDRRIFAEDPETLRELLVFGHGRYRGLTHRAIIGSALGRLGASPIVDIGCKNAQVGLELLLLNPRATYVGIERSSAEARIAKRRLASIPELRGRYELIVDDVFDFFAAKELDAGLLIMTWAPMIEVGRFIDECLPRVLGWKKWLLEFQLDSYRKWCRRRGVELKPGYHTYSGSRVRSLLEPSGRGRILWLSRFSRVSRVITVERGAHE